MNFRSLLYSAAAISIFALSNASALEISLGVKGGVSLAKQRGEHIPDDEMFKPGMAIGAALQLKLAKMFAIEPELLFSQKGRKYTQTFFGGRAMIHQ